MQIYYYHFTHHSFLTYIVIRLLLLGRIACMQCIRCGLLLQMSHVAWSVCLSVCLSHGCTVQKTAEPIKMSLGSWLMWVQGTMY